MITSENKAATGEAPSRPDAPARGSWFKLARHPATVRRALLTACIVGPVLIAINAGPAILAGRLTRTQVVQMGLTFLVPYLVSTVSSVATRREVNAGASAREASSRTGRS